MKLNTMWRLQKPNYEIWSEIYPNRRIERSNFRNELSDSFWIHFVSRCQEWIPMFLCCRYTIFTENLKSQAKFSFMQYPTIKEILEKWFNKNLMLIQLLPKMKLKVVYASSSLKIMLRIYYDAHIAADVCYYKDDEINGPLWQRKAYWSFTYRSTFEWLEQSNFWSTL